MRHLLLPLALLTTFSAGAVPSLSAASAVILPDSSDLTVQFTVDGNTAVPGAILKPGSYVIRVVDHMSDRSIIRVEKTDGKTVSTFLAVPNRTLSSAGLQGPVAWSGGSEHDKALRGYNFPGNFSVEFVYPKAEAVKIATTRSASVEAIDPASDNLPSKEKNLSDEDMRIVTLWTLTPTRVNGSTAIAAQRYAPAQAATAPEPTVARNEPSLALPSPVRLSAQAPPAAPRVAAASPKPRVRRPITTSLPHTASPLPIVLLAGILSLLGVIGLRLGKPTLE